MVASWLVEAATSYNHASLEKRDGYSAFVMLPVSHLETILEWAFQSLPDEILIGFDPLQSMPIDDKIVDACRGVDHREDLFAGQEFVIGKPHLVNRGDSFSVHHVPEEWVDELFASDRGSRGARFTHWMHTHPNCVAIPSAADADAVVSIAKEAGFSISADDLKNAQSEISEEELEGVAGGEGVTIPLRCLLCELQETWRGR